MSSEQDEFLPDDELMEELPEDSFLPEEEGTEIQEETENPGSTEEEVSEFTGEGEEETPDFSAEDEETEDEDEISGKNKPIEYRPPRMDLYTMLLVLSLIFIILATVLHWLEVPPTEYGNPPFKKNSPIMTAPKNP